MLECEIKLFDIAKKDIVQQLQRMGAKNKGTEIIVDIYLIAENKNQMRSRIRCTQNKTVLTSKWKLHAKNSKQAYEFDTTLPESYMFDNVLSNKLIDHIRVKKRTTYTRGGFQFDLDEYLGVPPLLEIEGPNEESLQRIIRTLGWQCYPQSTCGGKGVYSWYNKPYPEITSGFVGRLLSLIRCG